MKTIDQNDTGPGMDAAAETVSFRHDWNGDESLAMAIVSRVADVSETAPEDVERLYDRIDPDSLEALFEPRNDDVTRDAGQLQFHLEDCAITVYGNGLTIVRRQE